MKELIIISGKGGTGKTSLLSAFAAVSNNKILCDADVDAADLHLIMAPDVIEQHDFQSGHTAIIGSEKCTQCGICRDLCLFDAISEDFVVDSTACEGCGVCHHFCPENAVDFPLNTCGQWYISDTRFGPMVHAARGIAEENSGKLVTLVRQEARKLAKSTESSLILTDGPPGIGCPVIAAIGGANAVLIVTEPTVSGIHDMERALTLAEHFKVPAMVCVNKFDLNPEQAKAIEDKVKEKKITFLGKIPFDPVFTESMIYGKTVSEYDKDSEINRVIKDVWNKILTSSEMHRDAAVS